MQSSNGHFFVDIAYFHIFFEIVKKHWTKPMVKLYALRCCGGNGIWDIPLRAISHFSLWQIFFGISHFAPISQFQVHSRCGELKLGYPKIPKYDNIVVVAKKIRDIPHIPDRPNIPKNNVFPLWQKKMGYPGCVPISRNYYYVRCGRF